MGIENNIYQRESKKSDVVNNEKIEKLMENALTLEDNGELLKAGKKYVVAADSANTFNHKDELYNRAYDLLIQVDEEEAVKCMKKMNELER